MSARCTVTELPTARPARPGGVSFAEMTSPPDVRSLRAIKLIHTVVWAFFAASIVAIPVLAALGNLGAAWVLVAVVLVEVVIVVANGMRCPLTGVAARYTEDRRDNFDIYLPEWLARHNKTIFGALYALGVAVTAWCWLAP